MPPKTSLGLPCPSNNYVLRFYRIRLSGLLKFGNFRHKSVDQSSLEDQDRQQIGFLVIRFPVKYSDRLVAAASIKVLDLLCLKVLGSACHSGFRSKIFVQFVTFMLFSGHLGIWDHVSYGGPRPMHRPIYRSIHRSILDRVSVDTRSSIGRYIGRVSTDVSTDTTIGRYTWWLTETSPRLHRYFTDTATMLHRHLTFTECIG